MQPMNSGNLFPTDEELLRDLCEKHFYISRELVVDVYLILKDEGNLNFANTETLLGDLTREDPDYWETRTEIQERKDYLKNLAQTKYFQGLLDMQDVTKAIHIFCDTMGKLYANSLASKFHKEPIGATSGMSPDGEFNEQHLDMIKRYQDRQGGSFEDFLDRSPQAEEITEDEGAVEFIAGCGGATRYYQGTHLAGRKNNQGIVQLAVDFPKEAEIFFKSFTAITDSMGIMKKKREDVDHEARRKTDSMEDYDQLSQVDPSDVEREDFEHRAVSKNIDVEYNQDDKEGKCHLYVLVDTSVSMQANDVGGRICRAFCANVITMALLNLAFKEKHVVHVVRFDGSVDIYDQQHATDRDSALKAIKWLGGMNYNGYGTDVQGAVLYAYDQTTKVEDYRKCDIVLVTDGCSVMDSRMVDLKPPRTKLRTIVIGNDHGARYGGHARALKNASDTYNYCSWDNLNNKFEVGQALSGVNDPASNDDKE